jgi:hypothetical protein
VARVEGADRPLLEQLEAALAGAGEGAALAPLAFLAGSEVELDPAEVHAACRRAVLLLAAGGDPHRELDPDGRAVRAVAGDLDAADRRAQLAAALGRLRVEAAGLPRVGASLEALAADSDRAWRLLAAALLADELSSDC